MKQRDSKADGKDTSPQQASEEGGSSRRAALGQAFTVLSGAALAGLLPKETRAQLSTGGNRLVLQDRELAKRANDLFAEVRRDKQKEREFVENPMGVLGARLSPRGLRGVSRQRVTNANRILYALLANDKFLDWLRSYQKELEGKRLDKGQVLKDLAGAMARYGDPEFFQGMLEAEAAAYVGPEQIHATDGLFVYEDVAVAHNYAVIVWRGNDLVNPAEMRALTDLLAEKAVAKAKEMKAAGALQQQIISQ